MKGKKIKARSCIVNVVISLVLCVVMVTGAAASVAADSSVYDTDGEDVYTEENSSVGDGGLSEDAVEVGDGDTGNNSDDTGNLIDDEETDDENEPDLSDEEPADDKAATSDDEHEGVPADTDITGDTISGNELEIYDELDIDVTLSAEEASEKTLPEWYENGKKTGTFEIGSARALKELADLVNDQVTTFSGRTVILTADIDMSKSEQDNGEDNSGATADNDEITAADAADDGASDAGDDSSASDEEPYEWEPIGFGAAAFFAGTFDGADHTVSGIRYEADGPADKYAGVFGHLRGTVTSLTVSDCEFNGSAEYAGAVCAYADSASEISDCVITRTTVSADAIYAGGAVGYFEGKRIAHVINRADVTSGSADAAGSETAYAGGIAGCVGEKAVVINCGNSGAISANGALSAYAGGLVGSISSSDIKNCWNKGAVSANTASAKGTAAAGGLAGTAETGTFYNSYNDNKNISGTSGYTGYIAGYLTGSTAATADYVYWPGKGSYDSTTTYGSSGAALATETTCRGIDKIPSSSSLIKRLNNQVIASCDGDDTTTELYMWKLVDESNAKSSPEFREEAPEPIFPNRPEIAPESTAVGINPDTEDAAHTAELKAAVTNSDADVKMSYQWLVSADGESYTSVSADDGNDGKSASYTVTGTDTTGVMYYKLRVTCSDEKADASRSYSSDVIAVTTGWRIKLHAGGMYDGSAEITESAETPDVFPVLPDSGNAALPKPASEGNFFMGYAASHSAGQSYTASELMKEFNTTGMSGNVNLWSVFRPAEKISLTFDKGAESASVKEGVTDDMLSAILDEGADYAAPDGNALFENTGWRFMGWSVNESIKDDNTGSPDEDNAAGSGSGDGGDEAAGGIDAGGDTEVLKPGDIYVPGMNDVTFTAVWHKMYSVSYEIGSRYAEGELPEGTEAIYIEGESFVLPSGDALSLKGYVFDGWKDNIIYNTYKAGQTYTLPEDMSKLRDIVFTAQWRRLIRIEFRATGNEEQHISEPYNEVLYIPSGEVFTLPEQGDMKLNGYRFMGWENADGDMLKPGSSCIAQIDDIYKGVWSKIYNISFTCGAVAGDDTAEITGESPKTIEAVLNETVTLPENTYTVTTSKEGVKYYRFMGWKLEGMDSAPVVGAGADYELIYGRDITLVAQWRAMTEDMTWDGSNTDKPANGTGTESDPYRITKPDELAWVSKYLNKEKHDLKGVYFSLENDIDLFGWDWKPIGWYLEKGSDYDPWAKANVFDGVFNGNGHTIYGMATDMSVSGENADIGLFGSIGPDAKIYDLNLSGADVKISDIGSMTKRCGLIVGYCYGGEISNCTVDGTLTYNETSSNVGTNNKPSVGGIVGEANSAAISGCVNNAHVIGTVEMTSGISREYTGGIVGKAASTTVTDCSNNGVVEWKYSEENVTGASAVSYTGGIAGYMEKSSKISDCENSGRITARCNVAIAGGIVGRHEGEISDCENNGNVVHESNTSLSEYDIERGFGGIAGICTGNVKNCINTGNVMSEMYTIKNDHPDETRLGGITGEEKGNISNCFNSGSVTFTYKSEVDRHGMKSKRAKISAGGIAGVIGYGNVQNCFSASEDISISFEVGTDPREYESVTCLDIAEGGIIGHTAVSKSPLGMDGYTVYAFVSAFYGDECTAVDSSIINSYWLRNEGGAKYISLPQDADGSKLHQNTETVASMTSEEAASGKAAYLLDGGAGKHRNEWTQGGAGLPALGTPSYYKAESETDGVELSYGNDKLGQIVYAPESGNVKVVYDALAKEITVGDPYIKNIIKNGDTTTYDYWQKYYETADVKVSYADGSDGEISADDSGNKTFTMKASDASVSAYFETDITKVSESQLKERHDHYETVTEEPKPEPEPDKGSGGGSHGGHGPDDTNTTGPVTGPTEPAGPGLPENTGDDPNGTGTNIPALPAADGASSVQLTLPSAQAGSPDAEQQSEQQEAVQTESGGDNVTEPEVKEPEPEPEPEQPKDQDVFEVIQKTVKADPLQTIVLLIIIIVIVIAAGYRRYRKSRSQKNK